MSTKWNFSCFVICRLTFTGVELHLIFRKLRGEKDVQQLSPGKLPSTVTYVMTSRKNTTRVVTIHETGNIHFH